MRKGLKEDSEQYYRQRLLRVTKKAKTGKMQESEEICGKNYMNLLASSVDVHLEFTQQSMQALLKLISEVRITLSNEE